MSTVNFTGYIELKDSVEIETYLQCFLNESVYDLPFELEVEFKFYPGYHQTWDEPGEVDEVEIVKATLIYLGELELTEEQQEDIIDIIFKHHYEEFYNQAMEEVRREKQDAKLEYAVEHKRSSLDILI